MSNDLIKRFDQISILDLPLVGGKNASLGEMITRLTNLGIKVPQGFSLTTYAYRQFITENHIDIKIKELMQSVTHNDIANLQEQSKKIRELILKTPLSQNIIINVTQEYEKLKEKLGTNISLAVRSSANTEDLPEVSFAGQQETYLNVIGIQNILISIKKVYSSLYTERAISYRNQHKIPEENLAMSVGIQHMIRCDKAASGVMFTLDTETGFDKVVLINSGYGLGELLVQGAINPDEFYVFKPSLTQNKNAIIRKKLGNKKQKLVFEDEDKSGTKILTVSDKESIQFSLTDDEIINLAKQACLIENHYKTPMDIEWGKDGLTNELFILQARPETVASRNKGSFLEKFTIEEHTDILTEGRSVGHAIGQGSARVILNIADGDQIKEKDVLITDMTDPDWEPIMSKLSAIVTNRGGRTCHAAIVARELGIPAVIGTENATDVIKDGELVTVSCAEGDTGLVYKGLLKYQHERINIAELKELPVKIMVTIANPDLAFHVQSIPNDGVGLARLEFIIAQIIGIHPKACLEFSKLATDIQTKIQNKIKGYNDPVSFYVNKMAESIGTIAAAFWPKPVIVRTSDFKSNEYANLIGGHIFETKEQNPMIGFRGATRYISDRFKDCFALECNAIKKARNEMGLSNIEILIPFVRTIEEAKATIQILQENGLVRGENGLKLIMMCEIPSNVLLAEQFLEYFDGYSVGSNDLTQLTLGIDRDSELLAKTFDERNPAVLKLLAEVILFCRQNNKSIGICGQGPSDFPDFAAWLLKQGINSISLNPDSVVATRLLLGST